MSSTQCGFLLSAVNVRPAKHNHEVTNTANAMASTSLTSEGLSLSARNMAPFEKANNVMSTGAANSQGRLTTQLSGVTVTITSAKTKNSPAWFAVPQNNSRPNRKSAAKKAVNRRSTR